MTKYKYGRLKVLGLMDDTNVRFTPEQWGRVRDLLLAKPSKKFTSSVTFNNNHVCQFVEIGGNCVICGRTSVTTSKSPQKAKSKISTDKGSVPPEPSTTQVRPLKIEPLEEWPTIMNMGVEDYAAEASHRMLILKKKIDEIVNYLNSKEKA